jgi:hypothetical protein
MTTVAPFLRRNTAPLSTGDAVHPAATTPPQPVLAGARRRGASETISTRSVARGLMYRELPRALIVEAPTQIKKKNVDKRHFFIHSLCSVFPIVSHMSKTGFYKLAASKGFLSLLDSSAHGENPQSHLIYSIDFGPEYSFEFRLLCGLFCGAFPPSPSHLSLGAQPFRACAGPFNSCARCAGTI